MNYDYKKIGERIKKERKLQGMTQEAFAAEYHVKRSTVSKWEHGEAIPNFQTMLDMCAAFNCEMGYLLCEDGYENKTRKTTDICKATGLSEGAINMLQYKTNFKEESILKFTSYLIEHGQKMFAAVEDLIIHKKDLAELKRIPQYAVIEKAYNETQKGKRNTLFRNGIDESYFYSLLGEYLIKCNGSKEMIDAVDLANFLTDEEISIFNIEDRQTIIGRLSKSTNEIKTLNEINRAYSILEMEKNERNFKYEIFESLMDIVKDYIKEGAEDGGKD